MDCAVSSLIRYEMFGVHCLDNDRRVRVLPEEDDVGGRVDPIFRFYLLMKSREMF